MRRTHAFLPVVVLAIAAAAAVLAGCGSSSKPGVPTVSGSYGDKPTITFHGTPNATLQEKVLKKGTGKVIAKGDLMVADYLAQIYDGKVFDNTYDRGQPFGTAIGVGKIFPGWDETLVGATVGSRVELVLPPDKAYGANGQSKAGIKGTDTLVFVIDIVNTYGATAAGDPSATKQTTPTPGVTVAGTLGARPTVAVTKGTAIPKKESTIILAKGTGAAVAAGFIVVQYEAVDWTNKALASTWKTGAPTGLPIGNTASPNPFDALVGMPIGSRVLVEIPPQSGTKPTDSVAVVVDIVAEPGTAKQAAAAG